MKLIVIALTLALSACASVQQQRAKAEFQQRQTALIAEFRTAVAGDRRLDPIRDKIPLNDVREASLQMMALTSKPTEDEKQAIEAAVQVSRDYRQKVKALLQQYIPITIPIYEISAAANFSLAADLYAGKLSYGDFNRQRLEIYNRLMQAIRDLDAEMRREQLAAKQVAAQQSIATSNALAGFQNYLIGQQLINQQYQPARIAPFTCTRYGNTTNCF